MASNVLIVPATADHAAQLAPLLRAEDAAEVFASHGDSPLEALQECLEHSAESYALYFDGELAAMFGVAPDPEEPTHACVWALTSYAVQSRPLTFLRLSRRMVQSFSSRFPVLFNCVDERYAASLNWLEWLGFTAERAIPYGPNRVPFVPMFYRRAEHV